METYKNINRIYDVLIQLEDVYTQLEDEIKWYCSVVSGEQHLCDRCYAPLDCATLRGGRERVSTCVFYKPKTDTSDTNDASKR